ncbi:MAG: hypothetical protein J6M22_05430 [Firmicutes bacterium]|nr:hypothetical protein [Bacillota bacterium]
MKEMTAEKQNSVKGKGRMINRLVAVLACFCVLVTGYLMMQPALSMNNTLQDYAEKNGGQVSFTLTDTNDSPIPKEDGKYVVVSGTTYKLAVHVNLPNGIAPGEYMYRLPEGLVVSEDSGDFILDDGTNVGTWHIAASGLMTFNFNDNANKRTEMTITAEMGVHFSSEYNEVGFDGNIHVVIKPPEAENEQTELSKWGKQGSADDAARPDPDKIYWTITIKGHKDSHIPGSVLTDDILTDNIIYTESDMQNGITVGVSTIDPATGNEAATHGYHAWTVYPGDPDLTWGESGWTYNIPDDRACATCGKDYLGNENRIYYITFTSTIDSSNTTGSTYYGNKTIVDGQTAEYWDMLVYGNVIADVVKTGAFVGDSNGGTFRWKLTTLVPGKKEGQKPDFYWNIYDSMKVLNPEDSEIGYVENDLIHATVTATRNGEEFVIPEIKKEGISDIKDSDDIAWYLSWSPDDQDVYYAHEIELLCRCTCTEETCQTWQNGGCGWKQEHLNSEGRRVAEFCRCWNFEGDTAINFVYETEGLEVLDQYGGVGNKLQNVVSLSYRVPSAIGNPTVIAVADDAAKVPIPGLFKKELTQKLEDYVANYTITVNEARIDLVKDDEPLIIHDEMTETLAYMQGSLVITAEDANGGTITLTEGVDYITSYDGSGDKKDSEGNTVHVLDIQILNPAPVKYVLNYDAALIIPPGATEGIPYSNSANITLFGHTVSDDSAEKIYSNINVSAKHYKVEITKKDQTDLSRLLQGAEFGLYNENGGLIASGTTDDDGKLMFETNITAGIILREHTPYYIQEIKSPDGYVLEDTKYWFCFCDKIVDPNGNLQECNYDPGIPGILKVPADQIAIETITNTPVSYVLPDAGGGGARLFVIAGFVLVIGSAAAMVIRRRRQYNM